MSTAHPIRHRILSLLLCLIIVFSCIGAFTTEASAANFSLGMTERDMWEQCKIACYSSKKRDGGNLIKWTNICSGNSTNQVYVFDVQTEKVKNSLFVSAPSFTFSNAKVSQTLKSVTSSKTKTKTGYGKWNVYVYKLTSIDATGYTKAWSYTITSSSQKITLPKGSSAYYRVIVQYAGNTISTPRGYYKGDSTTAKLTAVGKGKWNKCGRIGFSRTFV